MLEQITATQKESSDLLKLNLESIQKHKPRLLAAIKRHLQKKNTTISYQLVHDPLINLLNLQWADAQGQSHSLYQRPFAQEFQVSCQLSKLNSPRILVFDGFGLGFHVPEFVCNNQFLIRDYLVIEKNFDVFMQALKVKNYTALFASENFEFLVGLDESEFFLELRDFFLNRERLIYSGRIEHFYLEPALKNDGAYYLEFAKAMQDTVVQLKDSYTVPGEDNYRGFLNIVRNTKSFSDSYLLTPLRGLLQGKPAVIVGAGPSLENEWNFLRANQNRLVIVAVDAVLKPLLKQGIQPHFVCCAERVVSTKHMLGGLPKDFRAPLLTLPSLHPDVYENYPGPVILMKRPATFGQWLWPEDPDVWAYIGVSSLAYAALGYMGCASIALLGQNLAFDRKAASSHVSGTDQYVSKTTVDFTTLGASYIEGNSGEMLETTSFWKSFAAEFEVLIQHYKIPTLHVIAADVGARLHNAKRIDPSQFWQDVQNKNREENFADGIESGLKKAPLIGNGASQILQTMKDTADYLKILQQKCYENMEKMSRDYHELIDLNTSEEVWPIHQDFIQKWETAREDVIDLNRSHFYFFLNCFFSQSHILHLSERENGVVEKEKVIYYLFHYMLKTQEWYRDLACWSARAERVLKDYV